jgi:thioredoxin-like negative regulator of GroEL
MSMQQAKKDLSKYNYFKSLALRSPRYVINLNMTNLRTYVTSYPRHYDVVMFFSAESCGYCEYLKK